jgi:hypothetical protein
MSLLPYPSDDYPILMPIIGRRGSGKGHLCIDLLKHYYKGFFDFVVWISPTFMLQSMCLNIEDQTGIVVFTEWKFEVIQSLFSYMYQRNFGNRQDRPLEHCLLILDDVGLAAKKGGLADQLDTVALIARHYKISLIIMTQRSTLLTTNMRSQMDAIIMFREENPRERINIYASFGFWDKERKKEWFDVIDRNTSEKYSAIGIRNDGGHFSFFDINGETDLGTTAARREQPRSSHSGNRGLQGLRDSKRYQDDLRRLSAASSSSQPTPTPTLPQRSTHPATTTRPNTSTQRVQWRRPTAPARKPPVFRRPHPYER